MYILKVGVIKKVEVGGGLYFVGGKVRIKLAVDMVFLRGWVFWWCERKG